MRWDVLFADLEAQFAAADAAELQGEVAEYSRVATGRIGLADRLHAATGRPLVVRVLHLGAMHGTLTSVGPDWLLLDLGRGRELLIALPAVASITGLGHRAVEAGRVGVTASRLDLRYALRCLVRDRSAVHLTLIDGSHLTGTLDRVGADHVDLAAHPADEVRREASVQAVHVVPIASTVAVRRDQ